MQILSITIDTVHYYSLTYEAIAPVTPPTHSKPLATNVISRSHTYSQITSFHPYAPVYQYIFLLPQRINLNLQHIKLAQGSMNFQ